MEGFEQQNISPEQEKLAKLSDVIKSSIQALIESNTSDDKDYIFESAKNFAEEENMDMSNRQLWDLIKEISEEERSK